MRALHSFSPPNNINLEACLHIRNFYVSAKQSLKEKLLKRDAVDNRGMSPNFY
jgi:hypothetical protein